MSKIKRLRMCQSCCSVTDRPTCNDCLRIMAYFDDGDWFRSAMFAKSYRLTYFYANCPTHGFAQFTTKTRACQICEPPRGKTARAIARSEKYASYLDRCTEHGDTPFGTNTGVCLTCYNAAGYPRTPSPESARSRRTSQCEGWSWYFDFCDVHGTTNFGMKSGRCLTCCTASGAPRKQDGPGAPLQEHPRAVARRAGETSYQDTCRVHGETAHSVSRGRCLICYNAMGHWRPA